MNQKWIRNDEFVEYADVKIVALSDIVTLGYLLLAAVLL